MKIYLQRTLRGLIPLDDTDKEKINKIPFDVALEYEVKVMRNLKFHRKFFAMLNLAFENQDEFKNFQIFREAVIIGAGFFEKVQRLHGEEIIIAKSISFSQMDNTEFETLYTACIDTIIDYFNFTKKDFESELAMFY
jgi:hypothetical protein